MYSQTFCTLTKLQRMDYVNKDGVISATHNYGRDTIPLFHTSKDCRLLKIITDTCGYPSAIANNKINGYLHSCDDRRVVPYCIYNNEGVVIKMTMGIRYSSPRGIPENMMILHGDTTKIYSLDGWITGTKAKLTNLIESKMYTIEMGMDVFISDGAFCIDEAQMQEISMHRPCDLVFEVIDKDINGHMARHVYIVEFE